MNPGASDAELAAAFVAGTSDGLAGVYRAYRVTLYSVAYDVLGNAEDAADCVHDALIRAWQRAGTFRPERGSLRSYLLVCVRNAAIERVRSTARHARIETRMARDEPQAYDIEAPDAVERERLHRALDELPGEQRAALELAYFKHLTHVEVAQRLGEPLGTVKGRLRLALAKLQTALR
jgi:RNA polymerase sigma-70 factor (ECF subfamily)